MNKRYEIIANVICFCIKIQDSDFIQLRFHILITTIAFHSLVRFTVRRTIFNTHRLLKIGQIGNAPNDLRMALNT